MANEVLTKYRLDEVTKNLEKLADRIGGYIDSNEERLRTIETTITELRTTNRNFMWVFGVAITIISIASNIVIRII